MNTHSPVLSDLFVDAFARYLTVRPNGLHMPYGPAAQTLCARLFTCRPARTFYENHQPRCRSLDGIRSINEKRTCASCLERKACTPQIYLELFHDRLPYRLLLAYTSARNFMTFASRLRQQGLPVENTEILISVRDRGRWGEVCFTCPPPQPRV
jgi:hypothetical protein